MGIDTPCKNICEMDEASGLCTGCGRTADEIGGWLSFSTPERRAIMASLPERMRSAGLAPPRKDAMGS